MVETRKELKVVTTEPMGPGACVPHKRSDRKEKPARHNQRGVLTRESNQRKPKSSNTDPENLVNNFFLKKVNKDGQEIKVY